jgi:hypothetical protein
MNESYELAFTLLRDGRITFDEFARRTLPYWRRQAASLMRRWRQPLWVSIDDVVQDLLLAANRFVWEWDPSRGTSLIGFVTYNAYDKAKKRAHAQRGAKRSGNADSNPSRMERPVSSYPDRGEPDAEPWWTRLLASPATQHEALEEEERAEEALGACRDALEHRVLRRLREGAQLHEVVESLYADDELRLELGFASERDAARRVVEAAVAVAGRLSAA